MSGEQNSKPIIVNEKTTSTSQCTITMNILFFCIFATTIK